MVKRSKSRPNAPIQGEIQARNWLLALKWCAGLVGAFPTTALAEAISDESDLGSRKIYAHSITQKLWKWGYLRKARPDEAALSFASWAARRTRSVLDDLSGKRGGPGRGQGRNPSFWVTTPKGLRRASAPEPS